MAFAPIGPVFDKVIDKSVEFVPVIGSGLKYMKTAKKITKFSNPVKATTYTAGMLLEICNELKFLKFKFVLIQITIFLQNLLNLLHK